MNNSSYRWVSKLMITSLEKTQNLGSIKVGKKKTLSFLLKLQQLEHIEQNHKFTIDKTGNYYSIFSYGDLIRTFFYNSETGEFRIVENYDNSIAYAVE